MRESKRLELKQSITNTFLKTVSAYANYEGGTIVFGIDDSGRIVGLNDLSKGAIEIENKINDSISPQVDYTIEVDEALKTISLRVQEGSNTPYLYKSQAYKRNDSATIAVDSLELSRLILRGKNINFEDAPAESQELEFPYLEQKLIENVGLEELNMDILRTLNLYDTKQGYSNLAAIIADNSTFPGIDIARFGESISVIKKRATLENMSILEAYDQTVCIFQDNYEYEIIDGFERRVIETIPEVAFREALANAVVHRAWDINAHIRVSMYDEYIEIVSPGGLSTGIIPEEFYAGRISVLRNPNLANVFRRLGLIEMFGTGILRIKELYRNSNSKPEFEITENTITIKLPLYKEELDLTEDEMEVYRLLSLGLKKSIGEILENTSFGKTKVTKLLNAMVEKGVVEVSGKGKATRYKKIGK